MNWPKPPGPNSRPSKSEGGYAASLMSGAFQGRVKATRDARAKDIAKRKIPVTGVSEFPLLEEIAAPDRRCTAPALRRRS